SPPPPCPRPGLLAPPPQLVAVPACGLARWHMELALACPRLQVRVWEDWLAEEQRLRNDPGVSRVLGSCPAGLGTRLG
ncbi:unnamed protein product, partial [Discosporangium mesarthrocarpum]